MTDFERDVIRGLSSRPKSIPPKYLYDRTGSMLFEEICGLEEYYLTRAELEILEPLDPAIVSWLGPEGVLIELGSGSSRKTRAILRHAPDGMAYAPVDLSGAFLADSAASVRAEFPRLRVFPLIADFSRQLLLPAGLASPGRRRLLFFPGSTIGNFEPAEALSILRLVADFDVAGFRHRAFYARRRQRVEMHLVSLRDQEARVAGRLFRFARGESIHAESSCKYEPDGFAALLREAGFAEITSWTDSARRMALFQAARP